MSHAGLLVTVLGLGLALAAPALAEVPAVPPLGPLLGAPRAPDAQGGVVERDSVQIAPARGVKVKRVVVDNRLGDVQVVGHDGPEVAVTVVKRAPDGTTLDRLKVNLTAGPDGTVSIGAALLAADEARPVPAREVRIDVSIEVPRSAHVEVRAWNGEVAVTGVNAGATLFAHAADVNVTDVRGKVVTDTTRGSQRLVSVRGDVDADTTFGDVAIDGMSGLVLAARAHEGLLTATRVRARRVTLTTTNGDIQFEGVLEAGAQVDIASYRGKVDVRLGSASAFTRVEATSRDGHVDSRMELAGGVQAERGRLTGTFGKGRRPATLRVSSALGDVTLGMAQ